MTTLQNNNRIQRQTLRDRWKREKDEENGNRIFCMGVGCLAFTVHPYSGAQIKFQATREETKRRQKQRQKEIRATQHNTMGIFIECLILIGVGHTDFGPLACV